MKRINAIEASDLINDVIRKGSLIDNHDVFRKISNLPACAHLDITSLCETLENNQKLSRAIIKPLDFILENFGYKIININDDESQNELEDEDLQLTSDRKTFRSDMNSLDSAIRFDGDMITSIIEEAVTSAKNKENLQGEMLQKERNKVKDYANQLYECNHELEKQRTTNEMLLKNMLICCQMLLAKDQETEKYIDNMLADLNVQVEWYSDDVPSGHFLNYTGIDNKDRPCMIIEDRVVCQGIHFS